MADYQLKNVKDFDLAQTLECGQCFHFVKLDEEDYVLTAKGHVLHVSQEADTVTFYDTEEDEYVNVWKDYFDMDRDYSAIKKTLLEKDDKLKDAIESMWGVRILLKLLYRLLYRRISRYLILRRLWQMYLQNLVHIWGHMAE